MSFDLALGLVYKSASFSFGMNISQESACFNQTMFFDAKHVFSYISECFPGFPGKQKDA